MKLTISILFIFISCRCYSQKNVNGTRSETVLTAYTKDSIPFFVKLIYDKEQRPVKYFAHIYTPVCEEKVCYALSVDVYWDLLGNFNEYRHPIDSPLTKFDHEVFTKEDQVKMYDILSDKSSLLKYYSKEELIDHNQKIVSTVIDGVTGATNKSLQGVVVSGAVHSTYILWNIINGYIAQQILQHTEAKFNDSLLGQMLKSDNYHYQYYALDKLTESDISKYLPDVVNLIVKGREYVPYFAIEKLPEYFWKSSQNQLTVLNFLKVVDFKIQNQIINKLKRVQLSQRVLNLLMESFKVLNENQLISILSIIQINEDSLDYNLLMKLSPLLKSPNAEIAEKTFQILKDKSDHHRGIQQVIDGYRKYQ